MYIYIFFIYLDIISAALSCLHELPLFKKGGFKRGFGGRVGQYAHNYNQLCLAVAQSVVPERAIEQCVQDSKKKRLEKNKREGEEKRER